MSFFNEVKLLDDSGNDISSTNPLAVREHSVIDAGNTSNTPLGSGAVFTGTWFDCLHYSVILVSVFADVASATDGLCIHWSSDGATKRGEDVFTIPANTDKTFSFQPVRRYMRIEYTNGASAQSTFDLEAQIKADYVKPSSHRIQDAISSEDDAELVKSVLAGEDDNGVFQNVKTTPDGNLTISSNSSGLAIAQGNVTGVSSVNKFGNAPDFDTGDGEIEVTDLANDSVAWQQMNYTFSTSADIDRISSSNAGDTQDIEIQGLDSNWDLVTQTITLTGQTPVALTTSLIRVFRMKNQGATDIAGYVFCFVNVSTTGGVPDTPSNIRAVIDNGNNQTEMAIYSVPNGKTGYVRELYASTAGGSRSTNYVIKLFIRPFGGVFQLKHRRAINDDKDCEKIFDTPEVAAAKSDIKITAETTGSNITASSLSAGFDIILVDN